MTAVLPTLPDVLIIRITEEDMLLAKGGDPHACAISLGGKMTHPGTSHWRTTKSEIRFSHCDSRYRVATPLTSGAWFQRFDKWKKGDGPMPEEIEFELHLRQAIVTPRSSYSDDPEQADEERRARKVYNAHRKMDLATMPEHDLEARAKRIEARRRKARDS